MNDLPETLEQLSLRIDALEKRVGALERIPAVLADSVNQSAAPTLPPAVEAPSGEQSGSVVTYFEAKGFGFLRPDDGGRDIFFHVSRLTEGLATDLRPGTRVMYELGMDRTGKMAASSIRIAPAE